ncbi:SpoIID/LytB domain-containing protein [Isoptericola sp. b490]|uniref:SpoIID/LytB domain-containing protein n=1 Tax=Actinotalea lenta TaxID=3064654 RepID=UPI002712D235|nr:SpoIID/LytB domain-containing protein [Isoptericola sp. b490]MDO8119966.1 SpoIID/LytB domain-containing protein [Isoptericola sp. b490]
MTRIRTVLSSLTALALAAVGLLVPTAAVAADPEVYPVPATGAWLVHGHGWGHGRGMSQWGAQGAAVQGVPADQILDFYYPKTATADVGDPTLRVGLAAYSPTLSVTLWNPPGQTVVTFVGVEEGDTAETAWTLMARRYTVSVSGQTVTIQPRDTIGGPDLSPMTYTGPVTMSTGDGVVVAPEPTSTTGTWYRGRIEVRPATTGFNVTNVVPMEEYLRGVVPRESPAYWKPAALQAQAVAARSYALYKKEHASGAVDLCDTTACQVYGGRATATWNGSASDGTATAKESVSTDLAIEATVGQVRTYGGHTALTEFSSSNGGWTRAGGVPYQVAKADPWTGSAPGDPVSSWTTALSVERVQRSCPSGGDLRQIVVLSRDGNGDYGGRVTSVRLDCTTGSTTISNPAFGMRSSWWQIDTTPPALDGFQASATSIASAGSVTVSAVPNLSMDYQLRVTDERTGRVAATATAEAVAGQRFSVTWNGRTNGGTAVGAGPYRVALRGVDQAGRVSAWVSALVQVGTAPNPAPVAAVPLVGDGGYVAVAPVRLLDTRETFTSMGARQRQDLQVTGVAGLPTSGVTAVVLNVTAVNASQETHLRAWPAGSPMPPTSILNVGPGRTQASMAVVAVGGQGKISLYNAAGVTHVIVDVVGYFSTALGSAAGYHAVDPLRAYDSRASGQSPLAPGTPRAVDVAGKIGIAPTQIGAVLVNLTTVAPRGQGYVVAYGGSAVPSVSTVNLRPGVDVANRAVVPVVDGRIMLASRGSSTDVAVDVVGWFGTAGSGDGSLYTPVQPVRLLDTRTSSALPPHGTVSVRAGSAAPAAASALSGSVTVVSTTATSTHLRTWPSGTPMTAASDVNAVRGTTQSNAVVVPLSSGSSPAVSIYNAAGSTQVLLDMTGYFAPRS